METLRNFINKYAAEDGMQFSKSEFKQAVITAVAMALFLAAACFFG